VFALNSLSLARALLFFFISRVLNGRSVSEATVRKILIGIYVAAILAFSALAKASAQIPPAEHTTVGCKANA